VTLKKSAPTDLGIIGNAFLNSKPPPKKKSRRLRHGFAQSAERRKAKALQQMRKQRVKLNELKPLFKCGYIE
jgi:hypothetical protein